MKGQVAFETLILLIIVITSAVFILSLYVQTQDSTIALSIARAELAGAANTPDEIIIVDKISISNNLGDAIVTVTTKPPTVTKTYLGEGKIKEIENKIVEATTYKNVKININ